MKISNIQKSLRLFSRIKAFKLREQWRTIRHYYREPKFAAVDLALGIWAFFSNPYRTCRKYLQHNNEPLIHAYGETPLRLFETLAIAAKLSSKDTFVEMGSGRGKLSFWAALFIGCEVRAVEWVPSFVRVSNAIARLFGVPARFERQSMFDIDLSEATAVYLYAIHLSDEQMRDLAHRCEQMETGAVLISIGEPAPSEQFVVEQVVHALFPWGETQAYIQRRS